MCNIKLTIEYDGTYFKGWQRQNNCQSRTVQQTIEKALRTILQEKIKLIGSGRTDAGVSALAQTANFRTNSSIYLDKLHRALNGVLPDDIAVTKVEDVTFNFHARFDAKSKVYRYIILNSSYRSTLLKDRVYFYPYILDLKLIQRESRCLLGKHNFKAFCASASSVRDTVRTIKRITIKRLPYSLYALRSTLKGFPLIIIDIEADGFLYNMVRSIVGTLIEIGRGRFSAGSLQKALLSGNRKLVGPTLPSRGLYLAAVKY